jgi:hypothetical protein
VAVETATYTSQLSSANPPPGDSLGQADDHLRLIKSTILATWPNLTAAACTPTTTELNYVAGVTSAIQTQFTAQTAATALKANIASPTFTGTVVLPSTTSIGTVSATEIGYLDNVTSAIQTQIDSKAALASPTLTTPTINGYSEGVVTANTSTSYTIDISAGTIQILTLTGSCTYTFPAANSGKSFFLVQKQDGTGSRTVTWPAAVKWPSSAAPTLTSTASKADLFAFTCDGTNWYGRAVGSNYL